MRKNFFEDRIFPVTESGCWLWTGRYDKDGYGMFHDTRQNNYKNVKAHRYAYSAFVGPIPEGASVLHKCDVTCCVNPKHLFLGTQKENMQDKKRKGRAPRGVQIKGAKLDEKQVHEIFSALGRGESQYVIAARFGICQSHVSDIKNGKRWSYIQRRSLE